MRGTIDHIEEKKTNKGKSYHFIVIDDNRYSCWEADMVKDLSSGQQVEFEFYEKGDFKNITEIKAIAGAPPPQKQVSRYDDTKIWNTCLMCAKDIMVTFIINSKLDKELELPINKIEQIVIKMAKAFYQASENGVVEEDVTPEEEPPPKAGTTFDSLNYQIINTKWANKEELAAWWADMQGSMLKMTEDERGKLIKTYNSELGKIK